jgi:hypothetical protein
MKSLRLFAASKLLLHGTEKKPRELLEKDVVVDHFYLLTELGLVLVAVTLA